MPLPRRTTDQAELATALRLVDELQPAIRRRDRASQVAIVRRLVALRAPLGEQWQALADISLRNGELGLAREAADLFSEASGQAPAARYWKTVVLEQSGAMEEAYALLQALPPDVPDPVTHAYSRGVTALFLGRNEEARDALLRATGLRPRLGVAWLALATSANLACDAELAERILGAQRGLADAVPAQRAPYWYALGKLFADRDEHAAAFAAFAKGAEEMKALVPYSPAADRRNAAESLRGYSRESIDLLARGQPRTAPETIFVTGLPRSGTSLVEQILTAHSAVGDGGETNRLLLLAQETGGHSCAALAAYSERAAAGEAVALWRHWMAERFPGAERVVDKSLTTTRLIGLAAALLPDRPLIWLTREPFDCAWSCFRTFFQGSMPWSHDLADIALHFTIEAELLSRWQEMLGERLLVVPYEELATHSAPWIRRILAHCGLSEEPAVFAPHANARKVRTASVMQVAEPIHRRSIGSAEPYREFLEPFVRARAA